MLYRLTADSEDIVTLRSGVAVLLTMRIEWKLFLFLLSRLYSLKSHHAKVGMASVGIDIMQRFSCSIDTWKGPPLATVVDKLELVIVSE